MLQIDKFIHKAFVIFSNFINLAALLFLCHLHQAYSCVIWVMHRIHLHRSPGKQGCESYRIHREDDRVFLCQCTTAKGAIGRSDFPSFRFSVSVLPVSKQVAKNSYFFPSITWKRHYLLDRWSWEHSSIPRVPVGVCSHWLNYLRWQWAQHNGTCTWQPNFIHIGGSRLWN